MLFSGQPVYDPNLLRPNTNPKKPVSSLCCVRGLGRALTALSTIAKKFEMGNQVFYYKKKGLLSKILCSINHLEKI